MSMGGPSTVRRVTAKSETNYGCETNAQNPQGVNLVLYMWSANHALYVDRRKLHPHNNKVEDKKMDHIFILKDEPKIDLFWDAHWIQRPFV